MFEKLQELFSGKQMERQLTEILAENLIKPLIAGVYLWAEEYGNHPGNSQLGMGSPFICHGWPDMVAKDSDLVVVVTVQ